MACSIWKARNKMKPLGLIFQNKVSTRITRSTNSETLSEPVPGYPQLVANKLAQVWNLMNLSTAKTLGAARNLACKWYNQNAKKLTVKVNLTQRFSIFDLFIFFSTFYLFLLFPAPD